MASNNIQRTLGRIEEKIDNYARALDTHKIVADARDADVGRRLGSLERSRTYVYGATGTLSFLIATAVAAIFGYAPRT